MRDPGGEGRGREERGIRGAVPLPDTPVRRRRRRRRRETASIAKLIVSRFEAVIRSFALLCNAGGRYSAVSSVTRARGGGGKGLGGEGERFSRCAMKTRDLTRDIFRKDRGARGHTFERSEWNSCRSTFQPAKITFDELIRSRTAPSPPRPIKSSHYRKPVRPTSIWTRRRTRHGIAEDVAPPLNRFAFSPSVDPSNRSCRDGGGGCGR